MFPAPGVYEVLITEFVMSVSAWTTPLDFDMPALTVTMLADTSKLLALTVTFDEVVIVTPEESSLMELPLLSTISAEA